MKKDKIYTTTDMGLAAALLTIGYGLNTIDKIDSKSIFSFVDDGDIEETANRYFLDKLKVKAFSYSQNLRSIKARIYS